MLGDLLEWLAAGCFVAGAYCAAGAGAALLVAGGCLAYLAQCYAKHSLPRPKLPKALERAVKWLRAKAARKPRPRPSPSHTSQPSPPLPQGPVIDARNLRGPLQ